MVRFSRQCAVVVEMTGWRSCGVVRKVIGFLASNGCVGGLVIAVFRCGSTARVDTVLPSQILGHSRNRVSQLMADITDTAVDGGQHLYPTTGTVMYSVTIPVYIYCSVLFCLESAHQHSRPILSLEVVGLNN